MPSRLAAHAPRNFDASEGLLLTHEVAKLFGVGLPAVRRWAKEAVAAELSGQQPRVPVMRTPGGDWRFSARWVHEQLEPGRGK